jgi:lipopolysaccharide transport system permease protein/teichoic acid transport system permease protein
MRRCASGLRAWFSQRELVAAMVARDFRNRYRGSALGLCWAFLHPGATLVLFWFVFQVAFHAASPDPGTPYVVWMAAGMLPWFYFSAGLADSVEVLREYAFLIRKTSFRLSLLPVVKLVSGLGLHAIAIGLLVVLAACLAVPPSLALLQLPYYIAYNFLLLLGLCWSVAALALFVRDIGSIVSVLLQFGFWLAPILWPVESLPQRYRFLVRLNPVCYATEGFRECFLGRGWFWQHAGWAAYYWSVAAVLLVLGAYVFRRLRPHFGDMV